MKTKSPKLPPELSAFIDKGKTTFHCDDGDWDLRIQAGESSNIRKELPAGSTIIAENGCGDYLFLKNSKSGELSPKVFVFWHEEGRSEVFAQHVKDLMQAAAPPPADRSPPQPAVSLKELEAALASSDVRACKAAIRAFEQSQFGIEALPVLRRALAYDDVDVVIGAAQCIGKLGPEAVSCPAGQEAVIVDREGVDLESQLILAGSKVWGYSLCANCYADCLQALVRLEADEEVLLEHIHNHIGLCSEDDLIESLKALKTIGSPEANDLLKRAAAFWLPELNLKQAKEVKKLTGKA